MDTHADLVFEPCITMTRNCIRGEEGEREGGEGETSERKSNEKYCQTINESNSENFILRLASIISIGFEDFP